MTVPPTSAQAAPDELGFPRLSARTQRFTLGRPRSLAVADDGSRVTFLRSAHGTDAANSLWVFDLAAGEERLVADARDLLGGGDEDLPAAERARRERAREGAGGIVAYAIDRNATVAAFALSGRLFVADLTAVGGHRAVRELPTAGPVVDPRPDPTGRRVAHVTGGALHVVELNSGADQTLVVPDGEQVTWGLAEFIAAEEMDRSRGYWWSPDGRSLLAARVDESPVQRWWIADPANPDRAPREVGYPAAGTPNAAVSLAVVTLDCEVVGVEWDSAAWPYLVTAHWGSDAAPTVVLQSRDQRRMRVATVDVASGGLTDVRLDDDPVWLEIVTGVPRRLADGRLVWVADDASYDTRRLVFGEAWVTPPGLQVADVVSVGGDFAVVTATTEATEQHVFRIAGDGTVTALTSEPGIHTGAAGGDVVVIASATLAESGSTVTVMRGGEPVATLASYAAEPPFSPSVTLLRAGPRELRTAVLFPRDDVRPAGPLPVVMDPYGGPHAQRVLAARAAYLSSQWFADQGFAVVVADGRGTPSRGPAWERAVHLDLAGPVLDDQVAALQAAAERFPGELDLDRVGIKGWSFGGYLAALAVLRRPDVFHAAVAGAPVTDWRLYDTHYTERYLGDPAVNGEVYSRVSLLDSAGELTRPLMIIHGLADDNVVAAHTLRLSSALLAAGRAHTVLPLSGVTHMTPQEVVAENLLLLQVAFLREALGG